MTLKSLLLRGRTALECLLIVCNLTTAGFALGAGRPQDSGPQDNTPKASSAPAQPQGASADKKKSASKSDHGSEDQDEDPHAGHNFKELGSDFLLDQKRIWTSPARLRFADADWLIPASGFAAGLFITDRDVSGNISNNPTTISHYKTISTAGLGALVGGAAGMWALSYHSGNEHWRETGILAGEAAVDSLIPIELMKYSLRRQRPVEGDGSGPFFQGGGTSFPSEHAAAAWAVAGVMAHEYPGFFPRLVTYGLASLISASRIEGKQHFPSDVFIGSMLGQLVAQDVYRQHHDPALGGADWRSIGEIVRGDGYLSAANQGSPYVPLDSWIYPAFDRLIAMGAVQSATLSMRPWTRLECVRLLSEAEDAATETENSRVDSLVASLRQEFSADMKQVEGNNPGTLQVESVYTRFTGISGTPLVQGTHYDFGQTIINDFGRPYEEGVNNVTGFSAWASSGRLVAYVRGEYQYAPSGPALNGPTRLAIKEIDSLPEIAAADPSPSTSRVRLLDAYVGLNLDNWEFSFGQQSLWWGPDRGGPMLMSDNAEPIEMFRINRVSPFELPSVLRLFGPIRLEFFIGQLQGQQVAFGGSGGTGQFFGQVGVPLQKQPFIHGQKIAFKPTKNFEFSFSRTTIFAGPAVPFTPHEFWFSLVGSSNGFPGSPQDPGDRRSAFDMTYRIPKFRDWLTFYVDGFTDDQYTPVAYWDRSAWIAGLYMPRVPGVPKLDLRVEGVYTDLPIGGNVGHGFFYFNLAYRNGYTNNGNLIGSWIGRQGQGAQAWSTYSISAKSSIQANYRHEKVSNQLVPNGGTITDVGVRSDLWLRSNLSISGLFQVERWNFPVLAATPQSDLTSSLGITFWPSRWSK